MKKLIMAMTIVASAIAFGSVDTYKFTSTMHAYSLKKQAYVSTSFNGTMVVDNGDITINAVKKDTKESFEMTLRSDTSVRYTTTSNGVIAVTNVNDYVAAIVSGKKNKVGAAIFECESDNLSLRFAGNGSTKIAKVGCNPCGNETTCTKIKTLNGSYVGSYDCGCENGQHYEYDFGCDLPEDKELTASPVWGTWKATLKSSVED